MSKRQWAPIDAAAVPEEVRFMVPRANDGQIVEVAYGTFGRAEAAEGDPYRRITDYSIGPRAVRYERRTCCTEPYCWGH